MSLYTSRQITVQNALGYVTTNLLDAAGRTRATIDASGNRISFSYDAASRQIAIQNPLGKTATTLYNSAGWPRATVNPLGYRASISYNAAGQRVAVIDANSNRTSTVFDATGRAVATLNALGYRVSQVFDAAGRRTALVDARANRYSFIWDDASRQTRQIDPLSRVVTLAYNAASEQTLRIDARGYRTTYVHDNLSRLTGRQYPDGSSVTMAYDAVSNRTALADSTGRYTTLYDALNRPRAVTNPAQMTISYGFDAAGRRAWMAEPSGGRFTYGYSPTSLNTLVVNPQGERTTWQFDAASRVAVQRLANLIRVSYAYDDADRLVRLANLTSTGTTITSYRDTWDPANNRLARVEQDGTLVTWSYDATYQLTRERRSGANSYDTTYAYDPAGNRRCKLDNSIRTTYSYDAANQLQKYVDNTGTTTFSFDASGNQRFQQTPSSGTTTNTWDYANRLTKVSLATGVLNTFTYNGDGLRVQRQDSSGTSKQIWDEQKIIEETDQNNLIQVVYTESIGTYGNLVSQRRAGATSYFLFDPLGSTCRLTDGGQNITDSYLFKAFGEAILLAGSSINVLRYVARLGYYLDADTTFYYLRARHYYPTVGRLLSMDPMSVSRVGFIAAPTGFEIYSYTGNLPVARVDPSGYGPCGCTQGPSQQELGLPDCSAVLVPFEYKSFSDGTLKCLPPGQAANSSLQFTLTLTWCCRQYQCYRRRPCPGTRPVPHGTISVNWGCFCGSGNTQNDIAIVNPQPLDELDQCCAAHDDAWKRIVPPCHNPSPGFPPTQDQRPECRAADEVFCACMEGANCSASPNPLGCDIYRNLAMRLFGCQQFANAGDSLEE